MKIKTLILVIFISMLTLTACSSQNSSGKYIEEAKLTKEEEGLMNLLSIDNRNLIYDFKVDENIKNIEVNMYRLKEGKWELVTSDWMTFNQELGRLAFSYDNLLGGYRIALQDKDGMIGSEHASEQIEEVKSSSSYASSSLSERQEIVYDEEIPIGLQVLSSSDSMNVYDIDSFNNPQVYEDGEYDGVYALTVRFSDKDINELNKNK